MNESTLASRVWFYSRRCQTTHGSTPSWSKISLLPRSSIGKDASKHLRRFSFSPTVQNPGIFMSREWLDEKSGEWVPASITQLLKTDIPAQRGWLKKRTASFFFFTLSDHLSILNCAGKKDIILKKTMPRGVKIKVLAISSSSSNPVHIKL